MKNIIRKILGIVFVFCAIVLLIWNENKFINNLIRKNNIVDKCIFVKSTSVDSKNDDKLIATNGYIIINEDLVDLLFNVSVRTSKLERVVEMYQYNEIQEDPNDESYTYETGWYSELIDSSKFKNPEYKNPTKMKYENKVYYNDTYLGAFKLTNNQIDKLETKSRYLDLDSDFASNNNLNISNEYYTTSKDIDLPEVGDIRISFRYNSSSSVSVLAMQKGNTFTDYKFNNQLINKIYNEKLTKDEIINKSYGINLLSIIIYRIISLVVCLIGIALLSFNIINSFIVLSLCVSIIYFKSNIVVSITSFIVFLVLIFIEYKIIYKSRKLLYNYGGE